MGSNIPPLPPLALQVIEALAPAPVLVVGGWVRTWLGGATPEKLLKTDCDLAGGLPPAEAATLLQGQGLSFSDAGLRWGTLTVTNPESSQPPIELTSLRQDSYLPGSRYPQVSWLPTNVGPTANPTDPSDPWHTDASRRDFTLNAIYLAADGTLFDPFNGVADLNNNLVRFIGEPDQRLAEDPLRWLRFWRFCAFYGIAGATPEVIAALAAAVPALSSLSRNRVKQELSRLEQGPWAGNVHDLWRRHGWDFLLPGAPEPKT